MVCNNANMTVTLNTSALDAALNRTKRIKGTLPITQTNRLTVSDGIASLTAMDGDAAIVVFLPDSVGGEIDVLLPVKILSQLVSILDDTLTVHTTESNVVIRAGSTTLRLPTIALKEWPAIDFELIENDPMPSDALGAAINRAAHCAAKDRTEVLHSVIFDPSDEVTSIVGLDRYHMHVTQLQMAIGHDEALMVPLPSALVLAQEFKDQEVALGAAPGNVLRVDGATFRFRTRTLNHEAPPWRSLTTNKEVVGTLSINRGALKHVLELGGAFSTAEGIRMDVKEDTMVCTPNSPRVPDGTFEEVVSVKASEPMTLAFNATYLMTALNDATGDTINFEMLTRLSGGLVKVTGSDDTNAASYIMQIRTS